jgi:hypothetical protein
MGKNSLLAGLDAMFRAGKTDVCFPIRADASHFFDPQ